MLAQVWMRRFQARLHHQQVRLHPPGLHRRPAQSKNETLPLILTNNTIINIIIYQSEKWCKDSFVTATEMKDHSDVKLYKKWHDSLGASILASIVFHSLPHEISCSYRPVCISDFDRSVILILTCVFYALYVPW